MKEGIEHVDHPERALYADILNTSFIRNDLWREKSILPACAIYNTSNITPCLFLNAALSQRIVSHLFLTLIENLQYREELAQHCTARPGLISLRDPERHRVVIVGAGVSGFAAAATLLEHNVTDLVVLEAADRIGGRIHTVEFGGVATDKGAEYCHGEVDNAVYELVGPYNLLTSYDKMLQPKFYIFTNTSSHIFNATQVKHLWTELASFMRDKIYRILTDQLLTTSIQDSYLSEALRHLVPMYEKVASAADKLSDMGAWGLNQKLGL
ncbi:hypothetical protein J6590_015492 [Homalodisca vitripennis]|nr:hypothetical protein J6590_015492 [Homalodisca vitripennis]